MIETLRVLLLEESDDYADRVARELRLGAFQVLCERVDTRARFKEALSSRDWDVIIADHELPHYDGLTALVDAREKCHIPFILVSRAIEEAVVVGAMRAGARDYVLKNDLARLQAAVERAVGEAKMCAEHTRMRERLVVSERMTTAGILAAGVVHEINNPLAVVMANLEYIALQIAELRSEARKDTSGGWIEGHLDEIDEPIRDTREAVDNIRDIVRDMQLFSRPHDDARGAVDLERVIESSIRMAWSAIRHRATVMREFGDVPAIDANEARVGQVLLNLIVNAAQAMPTGDASKNEIRIVTSLVEGMVVVDVSDTGIGIPKENLDRIFDAFFTTKSAGVATGLGLSISRRIITDLGGTITVDSEVGKGTRFRLTLPAVGTTVSAAPPSGVVSSTDPNRGRTFLEEERVMAMPSK